ncbi:MAG TPA: aldo/keto reductase [Nitrososphaeraceae archaeon]|nr:aldo/keto reductase [Nitrososphaeraceae archaeon]
MSSEDIYIKGFASSEGTKKFRDIAIKKGKVYLHFKEFDDLILSSIGMGTYLGDLSKEDDTDIENALYESVKSHAINVIDSAINYRAMKSEKSIGRSITRLVNDGIISRDEIFVSTKNGYITNDGDYPMLDVWEYIQRMYISTGIIKAEDISSGYNVLKPAYIEKCIERSRFNLKLDTIDLVYVHNAFESWHQDVSKDKFFDMLSKVFEIYEKFRSENKIRYYGMATWTCFRVSEENKEYLSLAEVYNIAKSIGGIDHGFRFIQLPYNLAYSEALFLKNQNVGNEKKLTILEAAKRLKIGVFSSVPLLQGKLIQTKIPDYSEGLTDPIMKLVQIIRSSPSIIAPLIGQKKMDHVNNNNKISEVRPLSEEEFKLAIEVLTKGN